MTNQDFKTALHTLNRLETAIKSAITARNIYIIAHFLKGYDYKMQETSCHDIWFFENEFSEIEFSFNTGVFDYFHISFAKGIFKLEKDISKGIDFKSDYMKYLGFEKERLKGAINDTDRN